MIALTRPTLRKEKLSRADGVYMGFPFIAMYGAVTKNQTLLQIAYDQCRLYRDALLVDGPTGKLWAHIYDDEAGMFIDNGTWATGLLFSLQPRVSVECSCICFREWMGRSGHAPSNGDHSKDLLRFRDVAADQESHLMD